MSRIEAMRQVEDTLGYDLPIACTLRQAFIFAEANHAVVYWNLWTDAELDVEVKNYDANTD